MTFICNYGKMISVYIGKSLFFDNFQNGVSGENAVPDVAKEY
jgi:hypothetical protein